MKKRLFFKVLNKVNEKNLTYKGDCVCVCVSLLILTDTTILSLLLIKIFLKRSLPEVSERKKLRSFELGKHCV